MDAHIKYVLNNKYMTPIKYDYVSAEGTAEVFVEVANKTIKYNGCHVAGMDIYCRVDRDENGISTYFHYWAFLKGEMVKIGSGGYIPVFHSPNECVGEFELKRQWGETKMIQSE